MPDERVNKMGELTEQAQENEGNMEFERMQRKYSLLHNEIEAMSVSLEKSRHFTWIWFVVSFVLMSILLVILSNWIGS